MDIELSTRLSKYADIWENGALGWWPKKEGGDWKRWGRFDERDGDAPADFAANYLIDLDDPPTLGVLEEILCRKVGEVLIRDFRWNPNFTLWDPSFSLYMPLRTKANEDGWIHGKNKGEVLARALLEVLEDDI